LLALVYDQLPAPAQLVVDGLWVWRTVRAAVEEITSWTEHRRLAWVEDPFPPEEIELCAEFRKRCPVPLGLGDELTDQRVFQALLASEGIDVVRVDATSIGGISGAVRVMHLAAANGRDIAPHFYPEVHVHCAAALPGCLAVEMFDPAGNDFEFSHRFVIDGVHVSQGRAQAPEAPGLGFELDWELIDQVGRRE
jgi:L-alanine-DL-glutamate epimerase-like enolase superfamily enzyme